MKIPPEFYPVITWWEKDGKRLVTYVAVAAVLVLAYRGFVAHKASVRVAASAALVNSYTTEELEESVARFSGTPTEGALKLRLAKSYFDRGNYSAALEQYEALIGSAPAGFEAIPQVGRAQALEATGNYEGAISAYDKFVEENPAHYLTLTAKLGAARSIALIGDKAKALERLETIKEEVKADEISTARVNATIDVVKRYEKRAEKSLFDAANDAAQAIEKETK